MNKDLKLYTVDKDNTFLRDKSIELSIEELNTPEVQDFIDQILEFAETYEQGNYIAAGLSAVQVGKHWRIFVSEINYDEKKDKFSYEVFVNPKIEILDFTQDIQKESCLSVPGRREKVARYKKIKITYLNRKGGKITERYEDFLARVIQHEYDHLDGVLFIDKMVE